MRRAAILLLLLLPACAERWSRPDATEEQGDAMNAACGEAAQGAVPPALSWELIEGGRTERDRSCRRTGDREDCRTVVRSIPPRWGWVDRAVAAREGWRRGCMREKGYSFEGYRPLRLW